MFLDLGLLLLRVGAGGIMLLAHGMGKLTNYAALSTQFPDPLGLGSTFTLIVAIFAEVFCAFLVIIGFSTRWAALPIIGTMVAAGVLQHARDPWHAKELAFINLIVFSAIALMGPGSFSLDGMIRMRRSSRP